MSLHDQSPLLTHSQTFFTATALTRHRMQGPLIKLAAQESAQ
ncbi:hypothetical protein [Pseudomonas sichuanensis]|uniref:Uncharacterized protein n=1 Tax=Pseudomonas sichuanensis TaxID=2213015 RepID=A0ABV0DCG1_9PSED